MIVHELLHFTVPTWTPSSNPSFTAPSKGSCNILWEKRLMRLEKMYINDFRSIEDIED